MMFMPRIPTLLALALGFLSVTSSAHRIEVEPGEKECFYETLQPQDRVRLWFSSDGSNIIWTKAGSELTSR